MSKKQFRIYIDESGDHGLTGLDDDSRRYLGLTGCIVGQEYYRVSLHPAIEDLKQRHFPHNPDEPVILHRREIVDRKGPFWRLRDPAAKSGFDQDLLDLLFDQEYTLVTVVIDKKSNQERTGKAVYHPYHYCLAAILERYCGFLNLYSAEGDVMAESRGGAENRQLTAAYRELYNRGTYFHSADFFQRVLTSREIKLKPKTANIAGLQLADLLARDCKNEILRNEGRIQGAEERFGETICRCISDKHNSRFATGQVKGYGQVFIR